MMTYVGKSAPPPPEDAAQDKPAALQIVNPVDLADKRVPDREWIVEDWLPVGCVTASYGDGGVGKTLLAHQLMTSAATGRPWCGREVLPCRSFAYFCEDDQDELHRRQDAICAASGVGMRSLDPMRWVSGVGADNALITFDDKSRAYPTELFELIETAAKAHGARLIVLDTAADHFSGNENDRHQVRQFIGLLNRLAINLNAAVLLNAHPSRSGLSSGNYDGGSTGWSNSVRSRWSLARPKKEDDESELDPDVRILTRRKANYAAVGEEIQLKWVNGVLLPKSTASAIPGERSAAELMFLTLLDRCMDGGIFVSHSNTAANYAPRAFGKRPDRAGCTRRDFEIAMHSLFAAERIHTVEYGRPSGSGKRPSRIERRTNQGLHGGAE